MKFRRSDLVRFFSKVNKLGDIPDRTKPYYKGLGRCWEWTGCIVREYGQFWSGEAYVGAHRYSWGMRNRSLIPEGSLVLHKCDNPKCVRPSHLFLGNHKANVEDRVAKGRSGSYQGDLNGSRIHVANRAWGDRNGSKLHPEKILKGSRRAFAKINEQNALEIYRKHQSGQSQSSLAREYGVSLGAIHSLVRGWTWTHATGICKAKKGKKGNGGGRSNRTLDADTADAVYRVLTGTSYVEDIP